VVKPAVKSERALVVEGIEILQIRKLRWNGDRLFLL